jgi:hypothetical protein
MNILLKKKSTLLICIFILLVSSFNAKAQGGGEYMRANLFVMTSPDSRILVDGNYTQYDNAYFNGVDMYDVWKMTNIGENFGLKREGYTLVMERRSLIANTDTTFFRMWNLQQKTYQMEIITKNCNHPNLMAYLYDAYTGELTEVNTNDTTRITFTVNSNHGSAESDRFMLVYNTVATASLPLMFTSVTTQKKAGGIQLQWQVEQEAQVSYYQIERSSDGFFYNKLKQTQPINNSASQKYTFHDPAPEKGDNFYRIHAVSRDGKETYSQVSKIMMDLVPQLVTIYPNPVHANTVNLQINTVSKGNFRVAVVNLSGKEVFSDSYIIAPPVTKRIQLPSAISPGMYRCIITGPDGFKESKNIILL